MVAQVVSTINPKATIEWNLHLIEIISRLHVGNSVVLQTYIVRWWEKFVIFQQKMREVERTGRQQKFKVAEMGHELLDDCATALGLETSHSIFSISQTAMLQSSPPVRLLKSLKPLSPAEAMWEMRAQSGQAQTDKRGHQAWVGLLQGRLDLNRRLHEPGELRPARFDT